MENRKKTISIEDHELYQKTLELHARNNTINHEEDDRPILDIVSDGLSKLPNITLY